MTEHRGYILLAALFSIFILAVIGCKTSPPSAPADTAPTVSITSPVQNEVCRMVDTIFVSANDDKAVTKVELYINGSLSGTDESAPYRFIWDTEDWNDGDYTLQAKAYDAAGHSTTSASVTTTIHNAFPVTFINTTRTSMSVTVLTVTRTILKNDSSTFTLSTNPRSLVYTASTSGKTTGGSVVGLVLNWGGSGSPINVSTYTSVRLLLQVPSTYFFMYMTNTGKTTLGPIYVNYGLTDQTVDYVSVPGDGVMYSIGYYKAFTNTVVRAYWSSPTTSYTSWSSLPFAGTVNQAINFTNQYPLSQVGIANAGQPEGHSGLAVVLSSPSHLQKRASGNSLIVLAHE
jgi:hypothetical protein